MILLVNNRVDTEEDEMAREWRGVENGERVEGETLFTLLKLSFLPASIYNQKDEAIDLRQYTRIHSPFTSVIVSIALIFFCSVFFHAPDLLIGEPLLL